METAERFGAASAAANLAFAVGKITTGLAGGSFALIADGIESVADVFSSLIVWNGLRVAGKHPDDDHPWGHGKAEAVAALLAGCALLASAGVIAVNAGQEIARPHLAPAPFVIPALLVIIVAKEALYRWLWRGAGGLDSTALRVEAWHHRLDSLTSLAVLVGVVLAVFLGDAGAAADDWAALLVAGAIAFNAVRLVRPAVDELLDRRVADGRLERLQAHARAVPGIIRLETVRLRKSGAFYLAEIHLEVDGELTVREGHDLAHAVKDRLLADRGLRLLDVVTHVEPASAEPLGEHPR